MEIVNHTPFAQLIYANEDAEARLFDILIVKASYCLNEDLTLVEAPEQEPLNFSDTCFGAVNETSLRYPSDLVPFKPATDVIVIADAHCPEGEAASAWEVGVRAGRAESRLEVSGPRVWQRKRMGGWRLGKAEPVDRVALRYENAYGGEHMDEGRAVATDERNPLGLGFLTKDGPAPTGDIPAPQILRAGTKLNDDPYRKLDPAGFAPIPAAWLPRRLLGGTYDQNWIDNVWPHWARDYDFAFHNSAAAGLKYRGHMVGNERIVLTNLHPKHPRIAFDLPGDTVIAHLRNDDGEGAAVQAALDTVYVDILDARPEDCLIALTWRLPFLDANVTRIEIESRTHPGNHESDAIAAQPRHPSQLFADQERQVAHVQ